MRKLTILSYCVLNYILSAPYHIYNLDNTYTSHPLLHFKLLFGVTNPNLAPFYMPWPSFALNYIVLSKFIECYFSIALLFEITQFIGACMSNKENCTLLQKISLFMPSFCGIISLLFIRFYTAKYNVIIGLCLILITVLPCIIFTTNNYDANHIKTVLLNFSMNIVKILMIWMHCSSSKYIVNCLSYRWLYKLIVMLFFMVPLLVIIFFIDLEKKNYFFIMITGLIGIVYIDIIKYIINNKMNPLVVYYLGQRGLLHCTQIVIAILLFALLNHIAPSVLKKIWNIDTDKNNIIRKTYLDIIIKLHTNLSSLYRHAISDSELASEKINSIELYIANLSVYSACHSLGTSILRLNKSIVHAHNILSAPIASDLSALKYYNSDAFKDSINTAMTAIPAVIAAYYAFETIDIGSVDFITINATIETVIDATNELLNAVNAIFTPTITAASENFFDNIAHANRLLFRSIRQQFKNPDRLLPDITHIAATVETAIADRPDDIRDFQHIANNLRCIYDNVANCKVELNLTRNYFTNWCDQSLNYSKASNSAASYLVVKLNENLYTKLFLIALCIFFPSIAIFLIVSLAFGACTDRIVDKVERKGEKSYYLS